MSLTGSVMKKGGSKPRPSIPRPTVTPGGRVVAPAKPATTTKKAISAG